MKKLIIDERELSLSYTIDYEYRLNNVVYIKSVLNNKTNKLVHLNTNHVLSSLSFNDYIKAVIYDHFKEIGKPLNDVIM